MVWGFESPPAHQSTFSRKSNIMSITVETLDKLERRIGLSFAVGRQ